MSSAMASRRDPVRGPRNLVAAAFLAVFLLASAAFADTSAFDGWRRPDATLTREIDSIARQALRDALMQRRVRPPGSVKSPLLKRPATVFVTLVHQGTVRGCMGSMSGAEPTAAAEIVRATFLAATADERYPRIRPSELDGLDILVSIVGPRTRVQSMSQLDPLRLGLLVQSGRRGAVLLPGEALSPGWQVSECRRKAGIGTRERVMMYVFPTVVFDSKPESRTAKGGH